MKKKNGAVLVKSCNEIIKTANEKPALALQFFSGDERFLVSLWSIVSVHLQEALKEEYVFQLDFGA